MHYPDGEELNYSYNSGGQMIAMSGKKGSNSYEYVNFIAYDKFGNRKYIAYGNGTQTTYNYDPANLRLKNLQTTTAAGRLIQNNSYIYDAVGNILQLTNNADPVSEENLYGGVTSNNYTYDNRYQLVSAEGTHQGFDKEHRYTMAMEYGNTGSILRKTQSNQWRKNEGEWLTDAGTSMDYRYSYNGQKPHAVSSIIDNNTETLFTYTYDASGNNLLETNSKASSDRAIVWTEDNRLAAIKAKGNVSHYVYDANGIRTLKMSSSGFNISINGVAAGTDGIDGNFTIYANPYTVVRENQCTKHFFLGSQRILTKISSSDVSHTFYEGYAQNQVGGVDYDSKQTALEGNISINNKQLNIGWYRETRGRVPSPYIKHYLRSKEYGGLSGVNPWQGGTETTDKTATYEEKQYYFHPDHLGSSNYLTDVLGEAYQHIEYLPWGEVFVEERNTQTSRNTFLYTGKELDEATGLYYYEQRYYDPNKSTFLGVDQLTDKYPHISGFAYVGNNPMIYIDPTGMIIDPSELTASEQEKFNNTMKFSCESSRLFNTMYEALDNSETVFKIKIGETNNNAPGQYDRSDNSITFKSVDDMISTNTYMEEFFHAYQQDNLHLYESDKAFNFEFEAKVAKFFMSDQIGLGQFGQGGTNFETMFHFLSPNGFDVNMPNSETINSDGFKSGYMEGAESFMNWNVNNNYGNVHYRTKTEQTPKSLIQLFSK